jgi:hypothetical protein
MSLKHQTVGCHKNYFAPEKLPKYNITGAHMYYRQNIYRARRPIYGLHMSGL